uniref:DUF725 domain-containing protein n=1 Tax=Macrostomum lignano TaxID=282301 RepID=A0A1I8FHT2_9PLAT
MLRLPFGRLAAWLNARGGAASTIEKLVDTAWKKMQDEAKEKSESLVTTVKPMVQAILEKKAELHDLIRSKVGEKIGEKLSELLQPILTLVTDPLVQELRKGVSAAIAVFEKDAKALLPGSRITGPLTAETIADLDQLARDGSHTEKIDGAKVSLQEMLETAKRNCGDASTASNRMSARLIGSLLELLDAMVFTAEEETGKAESAIESKALLGDVLEKAKLDGILETAQSNIPESMSDIIDLQAEYEALLEVSIGAAIEKINANICESFNEYAASELLGAVVSATVRQSVVDLPVVQHGGWQMQASPRGPRQRAPCPWRQSACTIRTGNRLGSASSL